MADESTVPGPDPVACFCSFCGKSQTEVKKLVAGPSVYICDECVSLCNDILAEERVKVVSGRVPTLDELVRALDEQLVGHDEQKRIIAANLLRQARTRRDSPHDGATSMVLIGPRGTGKSSLVERASTLLGLPVVVVDATWFAVSSSMVGERVFDALVRKAGSLARAETGVICIEHVDRILGNEGVEVTQALQRVFLDVMNGLRVRVSPKDPARLLGGSELATERLQLVFTVNLDGAPYAEGREPGRPPYGPRHGNPLRIQPRDLVERGMVPELVDRMSVLCSFEPLSASALEAVLRRVEGPIKRQVDRFDAHGMKVSFADDAIARIAAVAASGGAGVRSLWHVLESVASAIHCTVDASAGEFVVQADFVDECLLRA